MTRTANQPLVIEYLRAHTLDDLTREYAISVKRHGEYPNLVMLKYNQINSPMGEQLVQECRGIILDEADDWRVISYPFKKFFNYGEVHAAEIDWITATAYEKLDGSLMTLYSYYSKWHVASSGLPDASGMMGSLNRTMSDVFWETFHAQGMTFGPQYMCYMFELMTPWNRVVVPHAEPKLVLIGARDLVNFKEDPPREVARNAWMYVGGHPLRDIEGILKAAAKLNPMQHEGFVVADKDFNRIKVKSPAYVALHHMRGQLSTKYMLDVVRRNESAEFLTYFPEMRDCYDTVYDRYEMLVCDTDTFYEYYRGIADQKEFALAVKERGVAPALFAIRAGKAANAAEFYQNAHLSKVMLWAGLEYAHAEVATNA